MSRDGFARSIAVEEDVRTKRFMEGVRAARERRVSVAATVFFDDDVRVCV